MLEKSNGSGLTKNLSDVLFLQGYSSIDIHPHYIYIYIYIYIYNKSLIIDES